MPVDAMDGPVFNHNDDPEFTIDYTRKDELRRLAAELEALDPAFARILWVKIVDAGLMIIPWSMRWPIAVGGFVWRLKGKCPSRAQLLYQAIQNERMKDVFAEAWPQTIEWIVNGNDRTDRQSAGGWSGTEMATFLAFYRPMRAAIQAKAA